jgi:hypothetical protein
MVIALFPGNLNCPGQFAPNYVVTSKCGEQRHLPSRPRAVEKNLERSIKK